MDDQKSKVKDKNGLNEESEQSENEEPIQSDEANENVWRPENDLMDFGTIPPRSEVSCSNTGQYKDETEKRQVLPNPKHDEVTQFRSNDGLMHFGTVITRKTVSYTKKDSYVADTENLHVLSSPIHGGEDRFSSIKEKECRVREQQPQDMVIESQDPINKDVSTTMDMPMQSFSSSSLDESQFEDGDSLFSVSSTSFDNLDTYLVRDDTAAISEDLNEIGKAVKDFDYKSYLRESAPIAKVFELQNGGERNTPGSSKPTSKEQTPTYSTKTDDFKYDTPQGANPLKMRSSVNKKKKPRCLTCNKKLGLTAIQCRCGGLFCGLHRYVNEHGCTFDYRAMGAAEIKKNNPQIVAEKVSKL